MIAHPARIRRTQELSLMDPDVEYEKIYRQLALHEFGLQMQMGLHLAFYRTFSTPRIAGVLGMTGHMDAQPHKRAYDTGLVMYELIADGLGGDRGRKMVSLLNRVHKPWPIADEDFTYVLTTFIVVPTRWLDRAGWRPLTDRERRAVWRFYATLGRQMNLNKIPESYAASERFFDDYESQHLGPSEAGARLMGRTQSVLADLLPPPIRPLTDHVTTALLDDARLSEALSLPQRREWVATTVSIGLKAAALVERFLPPSKSPWFSPGRPSTTKVYGGAYDLADLGPGSVSTSS
ncbi:MAG: oxygenase MpaB family protein [Ornithinimicrobium sp.]